MKAISLRQRLLKFLENNPTYWNGGELERLAMENGYKGSTAGRRLRELAADKLIDGEERTSPTGVRSIWYCYKQKDPVQLNLIWNPVAKSSRRKRN